MKTIISLTFGFLLAFSAIGTVSAQVYYSYSGSGHHNQHQPSYGSQQQASYTYTQGCYTYYYNGYTRTTSIISSTCQAQNVYSYVTPVTYSYYTSPYYTYSYQQNTNSWYSPYSNYYNYGYTNTGYNYGNYYNNYGYYNNGRVYTPTNPCYSVGGYYVCQ